MKQLALQELPDGRKYCCRCKDYKGKSFFTLREWARRVARVCIACRKLDNDRQAQKKKIASGAADLRFKDFSIVKKNQT